MQYHLLLLGAILSTALAAPRYTPGQVCNSPGRVLTKTYTYDSTKDIDDPCNPVTGDPEKCLRSMEEFAPSPNPPSPDRVQVAEELAVARSNAEESDFDILYQKGAKKYLPPGF